MQDKNKKTKKQIKVQDLKPKKDAKGGFSVQQHSTQTHSVQSHGVAHPVQRPGNQNT
jgi:hypothetical protein